MDRREFATASNQEIEFDLQILEGAVPADWYGYVFLNSACGTVNSNGLPYNKYKPDGTTFNPEYGTPLISGDGLIIKFDLTEPGKVKVKTGLLKPPCYFADLATCETNDLIGQYKDMAFRNIGLGRRSLKLGTRNQLSTAVTPIKMEPTEPIRLLATFDAGRPFEFDPQSLKILTPITQAKDWKSFLPAFMRTPFESIMSTAHPVFDPETRELFTVNFGKKRKEVLIDYLLFKFFVNDEAKLKSFLKRQMEKAIGPNLEGKVKSIQSSVNNLLLFSFNPPFQWLRKIIDPIQRFILKLINKIFFNKNGLYLIRWKGQKTFEKWEVLEEGSKKINLGHNMHQIGFSRDYIILCDTNFKFTFDTMLDMPFPDEPEICIFFRSLLSVPMNSYSSLFVVKRSDLVSGNPSVPAKRLTIDVETVHFSVDYDNPGGEITLHSAHNCSSCVADWLRIYDRLAVDNRQKVPEEKLGFLAVGEMDVSKIGKIVINGNTGQFNDAKTKFLHLDGRINGQISKAHTWGIGLYTFRDILSPESNLAKVTHVYWQSYGLNREYLSEFIYNLYRTSSRNRVFSPDEVFELTKVGAPPVLQCVETEGMSSEDFYSFEKEHYLWSLQFVPKQNPTVGVPDGKNGYILTTVLCGEPYGVAPAEQYNYMPQIWIFDAMDLAGGPVTKLSHPDFSFGFTIHSVWVPEAQAVSMPPYAISAKEDYQPIIASMKGRKNRERLENLFEQHVYPHF